jgi:hypothetical protein
MLGRNFDITNGRVAREAYSATWNLGTNAAFHRSSQLNFSLSPPCTDGIENTVPSNSSITNIMFLDVIRRPVFI